MDPERFVRLALRELPRETDEQIVPVILGRLDRAVGAYLRPDARDRVQPELEQVLLRVARARVQGCVDGSGPAMTQLMQVLQPYLRPGAARDTVDASAPRSIE